MDGVHLRFYTYESRKHGASLMYEWLLAAAKRTGIHGGSAFRALAGFGRHGRMHEQHFFELAGEVPVLVEFLCSDAEADALLATLNAENVPVFYARLPATFGWIGAAD